MKNYSIIIMSIGVLLISGFFMERSEYFSDIKQDLQNMNIPSPPLNYGKRGEIMSKMGTKYVIPEDFSKYFDQNGMTYIIKDLIQLDVLNLRDTAGWTTPDKIDQKKIPSTLIIEPNIIKKGYPILSIVVDKKDLYDPAIGIFSNHKKKGRSWEKFCFISYFDKGILRFGTGAGVRVHGQKKEKGLRLYFRDIYGADQFKPGVLFDKNSDPIKHLVIHDDTRAGYHFINPLAYDIARKIGCIAPKTKPVMVYLNGKLYNNGRLSFSITEHLSREFLDSHFGHRNFIFFRTKFRKDRPREYQQLEGWANDPGRKMTMNEVSQKVDLENLSRWYFSQLFCGSSDIYQGPAILDLNRPGALWQWINWDMDHSFRDRGNEDIQFNWEKEREWDFTINEIHNKIPRSTIFRRLRFEDPGFIKYFEKLVMDSMNHKINPEFLLKRGEFYLKTINDFQMPDRENFEKIIQFLENRPDFVRKLMRKYFGSEESFPCFVSGSNDLEFEIDGFKAEPAYKGYYFKGATITVKTVNRKNPVYWLVNGKKIKSENGRLDHVIQEPTRIEPVFAGS